MTVSVFVVVVVIRCLYSAVSLILVREQHFIRISSSSSSSSIHITLMDYITFHCTYVSYIRACSVHLHRGGGDSSVVRAPDS